MYDRMKEVQEKIDSVIDKLTNDEQEITKEHVIAIAESIKAITWEIERLQEDVNNIYQNE